MNLTRPVNRDRNEGIPDTGVCTRCCFFCITPVQEAGKLPFSPQAGLII